MSDPNTRVDPAGRQPFIALALSGGGAKAMAFHLGCLRALHDRGILGKVSVLSTVSGGSVLGACYAYRKANFEEFDRHAVGLIRRGIQRDIALQALTVELFKIVATLLLSGSSALLLAVLILLLSWLRRLTRIPTAALETWLAVLSGKLPVWGNLTTAFEAALARQLFGSTLVTEVVRPNLQVVINACDLRTGTAFRFGSERSFGWRYGEIRGPAPTVAKAVAASAAFPPLLPPLIETFEFDRKGVVHKDTVSLTDGGVFDNLGVAVLEPGRAHDITLAHPVTHIISLNAGAGQFEAEGRHYWWPGRMLQSFAAVHRKAQDAVYQRLHKYAETGELQGFGMIYLGQQDDRLPWVPSDLVPREAVRNYPTDFAPISDKNIEILTRRGEQLTHIIIDRYLSTLGD